MNNNKDKNIALFITIIYLMVLGVAIMAIMDSWSTPPMYLNRDFVPKEIFN